MAGDKGKSAKKGEASSSAAPPDGSGNELQRQRPLHGYVLEVIHSDQAFELIKFEYFFVL